MKIDLTIVPQVLLWTTPYLSSQPITSRESYNNDDGDDDEKDKDKTNCPVHAFPGRLLMILGLLDVRLSLLSIVESCSRISVDFDQISSLIVDLGVDLLGNIVDISHELFDIVKFFLPLFNYVLHVGGLTLNLQLLHIELLMHQSL